MSTLPTPDTLSRRQEFFYAYDIRMGNPNGDPDENRPRRLPDGTYYVTDVRLKRYVRDYLKQQGHGLLVDNIEGRATTLTGRVLGHFEATKRDRVTGRALVDVLLDSFIDARLFGSSLAFKEEQGFKAEPQPKTLTGPVQINFGEVLHAAEEIMVGGTSVFASTEERAQGTFTSYAALRYGLIGFNGVANEHSARVSRLTDADYAAFLTALWKGVRSAGNTRTKVGQAPRLLLNIVYKPESEFQFGDLLNSVRMQGQGEPQTWVGPQDYRLDLSLLQTRLKRFAGNIDTVQYCVDPTLQCTPDPGELFSHTRNLDLDQPTAATIPSGN